STTVLVNTGVSMNRMSQYTPMADRPQGHLGGQVGIEWINSCCGTFLCSQAGKHFLSTGCEHDVAVGVEFHVAYDHRTPLGSAIDRHEPALRRRVERGVA